MLAPRVVLADVGVPRVLGLVRLVDLRHDLGRCLGRALDSPVDAAHHRLDAFCVAELVRRRRQVERLHEREELEDVFHGLVGQ